MKAMNRRDSPKPIFVLLGEILSCRIRLLAVGREGSGYIMDAELMDRGARQKGIRFGSIVILAVLGTYLRQQGPHSFGVAHPLGKAASTHRRKGRHGQGGGGFLDLNAGYIDGGFDDTATVPSLSGDYGHHLALSPLGREPDGFRKNPVPASFTLVLAGLWRFMSLGCNGFHRAGIDRFTAGGHILLGNLATLSQLICSKFSLELEHLGTNIHTGPTSGAQVLVNTDLHAPSLTKSLLVA
jgi:hypothetical protein